MRRNNSAFRFLPGFCILLLITVFANPGFAQGQQTPQQAYTFSYVQVKPGMELEFEELVKNKIPFLKKMGLTQMSIFKTSNFGVSGKYLIVGPAQDPAAIDKELSAPQTNIPTELVTALSGISRTVVSTHDFMVISQPDLNIPPAEDYEMKLAVHITIGTAPGREEDFKKVAKKAVEAMGKTKVKGILVGKVGIGGKLDEYIMDVFYDSYKEMFDNEPAVQKELAAADLSSASDVVYYRDSEVLVRIPELCVQPPAQ